MPAILIKELYTWLLTDQTILFYSIDVIRVSYLTGELQALLNITTMKSEENFHTMQLYSTSLSSVMYSLTGMRPKRNNFCFSIEQS